MTRFKPDWFLSGMVIAIILAWLFPAPGARGGALHPEILTKAGIALIFFLHGAVLSFKAMKDGVMKWRLHLIIQGATFILFPLLGLGIMAVGGAFIEPDLRLGIFFLCAIPSTVSSSVAMTAAARGNVPVAVFNATISSLIGIVATPFLMSLVMPATGIHMDMSSVIIDLIIWLVLPLVAGQALRRWIGAFLGRHKKYVNIADRGTILLLVYTSFCDSFAQNVWSGHSALTLILAAAVAVGLFFGVLGLLWTLCNKTGIAPDLRAAVVFCGTKKSLATGVPMASLIFAGHPGLGLILLPIMLYHPYQLLICAPLANRWATEASETPALNG